MTFFGAAMYPVFLFLFRLVVESLSTLGMKEEGIEGSIVVVFRARISRLSLSVSDSLSSSSSDSPTAVAHGRS